MSDELKELRQDLKEYAKITTENSIAIKELITLSSQSTKDTDKLIKHLDNLIPIHEIVNGVDQRLTNLENEAKDGIRPKTLKYLLAIVCSATSSYAVWMTLHYFSIDKELSNHQVSDATRKEIVDMKINKNENQITYLKGRLKG